jgi:hypothetical protein
MPAVKAVPGPHHGNEGAVRAKRHRFAFVLASRSGYGQARIPPSMNLVFRKPAASRMARASISLRPVLPALTLNTLRMLVPITPAKDASPPAALIPATSVRSQVGNWPDRVLLECNGS